MFFCSKNVFNIIFYRVISLDKQLNRIVDLVEHKIN